MADKTKKYPDNVPGKFYVDDQCIDCDLCRETAPDHFTRNEKAALWKRSATTASSRLPNLVLQRPPRTPRGALSFGPAKPPRLQGTRTIRSLQAKLSLHGTAAHVNHLHAHRVFATALRRQEHVEIIADIKQELLPAVQTHSHTPTCHVIQWEAAEEKIHRRLLGASPQTERSGLIERQRRHCRIKRHAPSLASHPKPHHFVMASNSTERRMGAVIIAGTSMVSHTFHTRHTARRKPFRQRASDKRVRDTDSRSTSGFQVGAGLYEDGCRTRIRTGNNKRFLRYCNLLCKAR